MKQHILITGATGMIGKKLIAGLLSRGHDLSILTRKPIKIKDVKVFLWNVEKGEIDKSCLEGVQTIVHLAGAGIAEQKWTKERKKQIIDSRVASTELLYKTISETASTVKNFISSSASGYYGDRDDEILLESNTPGEGFLAECCTLWEDAVDAGKDLNLRIVKFRTGFVLDKSGGGLPSLARPIRLFAGAALGTGKQWVPWIHLDDIAAMYMSAIDDDSYEGAYNGCAPHPVTNEMLTKAVAKKLKRPVWPINVPEKVLEMILGKMSIIVTSSTNLSAQKILDKGFKFKFVYLADALDEIYN
ncbi:TIGR01777 family oxidoreductase [Pedobacter sp. JCM 36344]|uniref:TIGR01777 family oxidoreductase n=1 Tax=Pedobacter sp. JCM 36344 TaxID=3374280 RepID=UPI00397C450B